MNYSIKEGTYLIINGKEVVFPRDKHWYPVSVLFAIDNAGNFVPVRITSDGKLEIVAELGNIQIGAVEIKDSTADRRINITIEDEMFSSLNGIVVFGKDETGKVKSFLFDLNNWLLVSDNETHQIMADIRNFMTNSLIDGIIERNSEGLITSVTTINKFLNKTVKITFLRNDDGEIISWQEETI